jgi:hypothetical protein
MVEERVSREPGPAWEVFALPTQVYTREGIEAGP